MFPTPEDSVQILFRRTVEGLGVVWTSGKRPEE